jgi:hypothetical protein
MGPMLKFLWSVVDLSMKLRKLLNGDILTLNLLKEGLIFNNIKYDILSMLLHT